MLLEGKVELTFCFNCGVPLKARKKVMADNKLQPKGTASAETGSAPEAGATNETSAKNSASIAEQLEAALPTLHRFRLPKFFSHAEGGGESEEEAEEPEASDLEVGMLPDDPAAPATSKGHRNGKGSKAPAPSTASDVSVPSDELALVQMQLEELTDQIRQVNEREGAMEKVFNTLHSELADYKNDFLYEHLKPVVRPLLFLFDSLEQFDGEISMAEGTLGETAEGGVLSPSVVHENVRYFRDQLVEALRVCEVVIMDPPSGNFTSKLHKAVDIIPVGAEEDGKIVRVVRSGWFLNGQLLRPAEVVVGKFRPQS